MREVKLRYFTWHENYNCYNTTVNALFHIQMNWFAEKEVTGYQVSINGTRYKHVFPDVEKAESAIVGYIKNNAMAFLRDIAATEKEILGEEYYGNSTKS